MEISIFGLGYVGCTLAACLLREGHNIVGVDVNRHKVNLINKGEMPVQEPGLIEIIKPGIEKQKIKATSDYKKAVKNTQISIVCVNTPNNPNHTPNFNNFFNAIKEISEAIKIKDFFHVVMIKSTVLPGTNKKVSKMIEELSNKKIMLIFA